MLEQLKYREYEITGWARKGGFIINTFTHTFKNDKAAQNYVAVISTPSLIYVAERRKNNTPTALFILTRNILYFLNLLENHGFAHIFKFYQKINIYIK